jgi:uncharacterized protein (TIGR03643 family)
VFGILKMSPAVNVVWFKRDLRVQDHAPLAAAAKAGRLISRSAKGESMTQEHTEAFMNDIIRMAWADDVSFDKIKKDKGLSEAEVIKLMRANLKASSFKLWRKRVSGRSSKHEKRAKLLRQEAE